MTYSTDQELSRVGRIGVRSPRFFMWQAVAVVLVLSGVLFSSGCYNRYKVGSSGNSSNAVNNGKKSVSLKEAESFEEPIKDPLKKHPGLFQRYKGYSIVVYADLNGVWINGKLIGRLIKGRIPPMGSSENISKFGIPVLKRRFVKVLGSVPMSEWNLLLVVSLDVEMDVIQRVLQAAGLAGINKYKLERVLER